MGLCDNDLSSGSASNVNIANIHHDDLIRHEPPQTVSYISLLHAQRRIPSHRFVHIFSKMWEQNHSQTNARSSAREGPALHLDHTRDKHQ